VSAATVGAEMPAQVTLDDLAAMAAADENHRYELSPEGVLSIMPPADPDHALLVTRILAWFLTSGFGPEQVVVDCGIDAGGGRVPDISVWAQGRPPRRARSSYAGVDGLLLVIEVVSKGSEIADRVVKKVEYAKVGIPHYWIVERDAGNTVHQLTLNLETGEYDRAPDGAQPLAWLLTTAPELS
jgi:Uma2 family endonuclease